jgi:hypothetical protein
MSNQLTLFPIVRVQHVKGETLDQRFDRWIAANPHVLSTFIRFALEMKAKGRKHLGRQLIIERMRWEWMGRTEGDDFKMSNSYTSRLVRLAIKTCPELDGMFELRPLRPGAKG